MFLPFHTVSLEVAAPFYAGINERYNQVGLSRPKTGIIVQIVLYEVLPHSFFEVLLSLISVPSKKY